MAATAGDDASADAGGAFKISVPVAADEAKREAEYRERYGDDILARSHSSIFI